tara:strand:+ start:5661 stop:6350 length:690 start_codon:yes stop_codon:yes gene_type:complete
MLALAIPLYDEEGNVRAVVKDLLSVFRKAAVPLQLILVDNGSRDGTRAAVRELEAEAAEVQGVYLDQNQGYGGGILAGLQQASEQAEVIGYMWGDGQIVGSDVIRVYRRLVSEKVELAKARRVERIDGWRRALISRCYNTLTLWLFHITSPDTNGCPKLFTREAWDLLAPTSRDWFLDAELMIGVARRGLRHAEVDVVGRARHSGQSKVGTGTLLEFCVNIFRARGGDL